jgi:shikimate kinase
MINGDKNIFLTGFMGAGKSTTGRLLAEQLGYEFVDIDQEIVNQEGCSITEIFAVKSESYFRDCETHFLADLKNTSRIVFATGGGIVQRAENRALMRKTGVVVYLSADWATLRKRLQISTDRPLVDPGKNWHDVERLWVARQQYYNDADIIVDTNKFKPVEIADTIKHLVEMESA